MAAWPATVPIAKVDLQWDENIVSTQSSFTRQRQTQTLDGGTSDRLAGVLTTPKLTAAQMQTLFDFLQSTGLYGTFTISLPGYVNPSSPATINAILTSVPEGSWSALGAVAISVSFEEATS